MAVTEKSIKLLWSNAAGLCSYPDCMEKLSIKDAAGATPYTLGEMAHIKGNRAGSNRYDEKQAPKDRDDYENLILLCPTHHTLIDRPENANRYSVDILKRIKSDHEALINTKLSAEKFKDADQTKDAIAIHLAENHQTWKLYGPTSYSAKHNPHNKAIYAVWTSERLSTIVPNNRKIVKILMENRNLFTRSEQDKISEFISHVKSYESWVNNKIPYSAVLRFPKAFDHLINGE